MIILEVRKLRPKPHVPWGGHRWWLERRWRDRMRQTAIHGAWPEECIYCDQWPHQL